MFEWSSVSSSLCLVLSFKKFSHYDRYVVISYCGFNLHFTYGSWCCTYFHGLTYYLHIFFHGMSLFMPFAHFLLGWFVFHCWVLRNLYIYFRYKSFVISWFANIFSQSVTYLFILFTRSFTKQNTSLSPSIYLSIIYHLLYEWACIHKYLKPL